MFFVALHVLLCVLLVLIILLQPGKGGDVGAAFGGGGGGTMFGPRGPAGLLARATTFVAIGFMVTSITHCGASPSSANFASRAGSPLTVSLGADTPEGPIQARVAELVDALG